MKSGKDQRPCSSSEEGIREERGMEKEGKKEGRPGMRLLLEVLARIHSGRGSSDDDSSQQLDPLSHEKAAWTEFEDGLAGDSKGSTPLCK